MERYAKLTYASNPNMKQYIGSFGYLSCDEYGRYAFRMEKSGLTIQTSAAKPNTTLGDVNHPVCRNIGFETLSGSAYQFDFMDIERLQDGVRREENHFLGFEHDYGDEPQYNVGDQVYAPDGTRGIVIGVDCFGEGRRTGVNVVLETGESRWYEPKQLTVRDVSLESKICDAKAASMSMRGGEAVVSAQERVL